MTKRCELIWDRAVSPNLAEGNSTLVNAYARTTQLSDGKIVSICRQGAAKHSHDGEIIIITSNDIGQSWSSPTTLFKKSDFSSSETIISAGICAIGENKLLATCGTMVDVAPNDYLFSEESASLDRRYFWILSEDGGQQWSHPMAIDTSPYHRAGVTANPFVLSDGIIRIPLEVTNEAGVQATALTFAHYAAGQIECGPIGLCAGDPTGQLNLSDAQFTTLENGDLLMLLWTFRQKDEETIDAHQSISRDAGRSWSTPQPTGVQGQITVPLALSCGTVVAVSNYRLSPPGIYLWQSCDGAKTWDSSPIRLWDERIKKVTAESAPLNTSTKEDEGVWDQLQAFTFGTPNLLRLVDGTVLMTYYATIDDIIHIRACRFQMV